MIPSVAGLIVCTCLCYVGWRMRATFVVALFASLPFASTAFAELTALGGSTPLIYTLMSLLLVAAAVSRRTFVYDLRALFRSEPVAWLVLGLVLYAVASAMLLPRIFAGETTAFVILRGAIMEQPLAPTTGNITQTAYFALGALTFYALLIELIRRDAYAAVHKGLFVFVTLSISLGILDLGAKLGGAGDVLLPLRTASYSLLTEVSVGSFWRIVGAAPEASTFGVGMLACLAFCITYWRNTGSRSAWVLAALSFVLCVFSTSSTAYAGLAILAVVLGGLILRDICRGGISSRDVSFVALAPVVLISALGISLVERKALEPVEQLIDTMIINKSTSASGQERAYWNRRSVATISETYGLGTGFGSSRASSWVIAVASQLGLVGGLLMAATVAVLLRGPSREMEATHGREMLAMARGARAAAFAFLVGAAVSGGAADPGILFFISLAVCVASWHVRPVDQGAGAKQALRTLNDARG